MSNFKLSSARLIVSTYGKAFSPAFRAPPHVLAENLTGASTIINALKEQQKNWAGNNLATPEAALAQARADLGAAISAATGKSNTIEGVAAAYKPIYDKIGNIIGHETIGWLYEGGQALTQEFFDVAGTLEIGMVACVYLAVVPA